jgi:hypothetical protein
MVCELALNLFTSFTDAPSVAYGVQHSAAMCMWLFLCYHFYARLDARNSPLYDPRGYLAAAREADGGGGGGGEALLGGASEGARATHVVWGGALAERIPPAAAAQSAAEAPPAYTLM